MLGCGDQTELRVSNAGVRVGKVGVIEPVEKLSTQAKHVIVMEREVLMDSDIHIIDAWANEGIEAGVPERVCD